MGKVGKSGNTKKAQLLKLIRIHCTWCCGGQVKERKECTACDCALWPHRNGNAKPEARGKIAGTPLTIVDEGTGEVKRTSLDDFPECTPDDGPGYRRLA